METMKAAVFEKEGSLVLKEVPVPEITADDQVIVEVEACSICGTDVHITGVPAGYVATPNTILGRKTPGNRRQGGCQPEQLLRQLRLLPEKPAQPVRTPGSARYRL